MNIASSPLGMLCAGIAMALFGLFELICGCILLETSTIVIGVVLLIVGLLFLILGWMLKKYYIPKKGIRQILAPCKYNDKK